MQLDSDRSRTNAIRTVPGGADSMKTLSDELKKGKHSAVIILERSEGEEKIRGYISFKNGSVAEALYKKSLPGGTVEAKQGREALRKVWHDALNKQSKLRVYYISVQEAAPAPAASATGLMEKQKKFKKLKDTASGRTMPGGKETVAEGAAAIGGEAERGEGETVYTWGQTGITDNGEDGTAAVQRESGGAGSTPASRTKAEHIGKGQADRGTGRTGKQAGTTGSSSDVQGDYDGVYSLVFGIEKKTKSPIRCPNCSSMMSGSICSTCGYSTVNAVHSGLNPSMQFSNFVVGPGNKFPYAASLSIASGEENYNPLYLYSASGLGKTHLLNAIGNRYASQNRNARVLYTGAERFCDEVAESRRSGSRDSAINRYRNVDLLLLDDVQFLAGREEAQSEFLAVMSSMLKEGRHVVCAADRLPKEIKGLDGQIASRLEAGLIVDIRSPDFEMRVRILEMKIREENYSVPPAVVKFIAESFDENIRELTGALNRIVAYSVLMKLPPSVEIAKRIVHGSREQVKENRDSVDLKPGHGYLIEEDRPDLCHLLVQEKLSEKWAALDITRMNPSRLRSKYPGLENARVVWLTDRESEKETTLSPSLEKIEYEIKGFLEEKSSAGARVIVNIDDLQYVISNTNFEGTVRLIRRMMDEISERNSLLLVSVGKETLGRQELAILEREMDAI
jgi:chromosomal replication initiator protein DnaA